MCRRRDQGRCTARRCPGRHRGRRATALPPRPTYAQKQTHIYMHVYNITNTHACTQHNTDTHMNTHTHTTMETPNHRQYKGTVGPSERHTYTHTHAHIQTCNTNLAGSVVVAPDRRGHPQRLVLLNQRPTRRHIRGGVSHHTPCDRVFQPHPLDLASLFTVHATTMV